MSFLRQNKEQRKLEIKRKKWKGKKEFGEEDQDQGHLQGQDPDHHQGQDQDHPPGHHQGQGQFQDLLYRDVGQGHFLQHLQEGEGEEVDLGRLMIFIRFLIEFSNFHS